MQKCASSSRLGPATLRRCPSSSRRAPHFFRSFHRRPCPPPAGRRTYSKSLGGSSWTVSSTCRPERAARPCSCRQENGSRRRERNAIMRIYTRLYEPCHAAGAGDWRGNAAPRIGRRPEDLTTKLQTIQRDLQQGRSLENRQGQEILREGGRGSKTSSPKVKNCP